MKRTSLPLLCLAIASIIACETSLACTLQNANISRAMADKVSIFTASGKFERVVNPDEVLPGKVVACNVALGLVQIQLSNGQKVWIDPIDVKKPNH